MVGTSEAASASAASRGTRPSASMAPAPTTAAAHQYWTIEDPAARAQQKIHFWKNASLLGGLLLVAFD